MLIVGDFNLPNINWTDHTSSGAGFPQKFLDTLDDNFLRQHLEEKTRARGLQQASMLDLVITRNDRMIQELSITHPLGKSDYGILTFEYPVKYQHIGETPTERLNYNKANYR